MKTLLITLLALAPAAASQVTLVPSCEFRAISPDGSAVTGRAGQFADGGALRWTSGTTYTEIGGASSGGIEIADGGFTLLGLTPSALNPQIPQPARWNIFTGWTPLPGPPGVPAQGLYLEAHDMSLGGQTVAGRLRTSNVTPWMAYRWSSAGGTELIPTGPFTSESAAFAISRNGQVIGGQILVVNPLTQQETAQPCLFLADGSVQTLLPPATPLGITSSVLALDDDGDTAFGLDPDLDPFVWRDGEGITWLPGSADGSVSANSMSPLALGDDGSFVFGGKFGLTTPFWLWTPQTGTLAFDDVLDDLGLLADVPDDGIVRWLDVSADGTRIIGNRERAAALGLKLYDGLVVDIPSPATFGAWDDLGGAKGIPFGPTPALRGNGLQFAGTPTELTVDFGQPYAAALIVGFSELSAPFKGGVLVPRPDVILNLPFALGGETTLAFDWPDGIPAGTSLWYQAWMPNASVGFVASNALRSTTR